jgi:drug/metabolite transporter (DMT)-like permease
MSWPVWIVIAVVAQAIEQLLNRRYLSKISQYWEFLLGYSFAAVLVSLVLLSGDAQFAQMTGVSFLLLLLSGVFWFFTYLFNARAYQQVEVSLTSLLTQIQVVLVFLGGIVFFAEPLTLNKLFGTALIVGGISLRSTSFGRASLHGLIFKLLAITAGAAALLIDKRLTALTAPAVIQLWGYAVPTVLIVIMQPGRLVAGCRLARDLNFANLGLGAINALVAYALLHAFAAADVSTAYPLYQVYTVLTILAAHFLLRESGGLRTKLLSAGAACLGVVFLFR